MATAEVLQFQDIETEQVILSTALARKAVLLQVLDLDPDDFYAEAHRFIFQAMKDLHDQGEAIDSITVKGKLQDNGHYSKQMSAYFPELLTSGYTVNPDNVIRRIREYANRRRLYLATQDAQTKLKRRGSVEDVIREITGSVREIDRSTDLVTFFDLSREGHKSFIGSDDYIKTGLFGIDKMIDGLYPQEFVIIAARPGIGKSTLALQIATHTARTVDTLFISLEMPASQLALKMIASKTQINSRLIRKGELTSEEIEKINQSIPSLSSKKLTITDNARSLAKIENVIDRHVQNHGCKIVFIDYLQLIQVPTKEKRYMQIGEITRKLKSIAMENNITVVALSQLNRAAESEAPKLSDLRESGDIEQDADMILFIHDPSGRENSDGGEVKIGVAKNRNGSVGSCELYYHKKYSKFTDIAFNVPDYFQE